MSVSRLWDRVADKFSAYCSRFPPAEWLPWLVLGGSFLWVRIPCLSSVPDWDGRFYYLLVQHASTAPWAELHLQDFLFAGHPSLVWALISTVPGRIFPGSIVAFNGFFLGLDILALVLFALTARAMASSRVNSHELVLITACYGLNRIVLSTQVNYTLDSGLLLFFVVYLFAFSTGRLPLALAMGTSLLLTKEHGVFLATIPPFFALFFGNSRSRPLPRSDAFFLVIGAGVTIVAYLLLRKILAPSGSIFWSVNPFDLKDELSMFLNPLGDIEHTVDCLKIIFIANYAWVLTAIVFAFIIFRAVLYVLSYSIWISGKLPDSMVLLLNRSIARTVDAERVPFFRSLWFPLVLVSTIYCFVRFPTFLNTRYQAPILPVFILFFWRELTWIFRSTLIRSAILCLVLIFECLGIYKSEDPLSLRMFQSFKLGDHTMLAYGPRGDCMGRDELVYNLQYLEVSRLVNRAMRTITPTDGTVILVQPDALWPDYGQFGPIDCDTLERSVKPANYVSPTIMSVSQFPHSSLPPVAWYIELPFYNRSGNYSSQLSSLYEGRLQIPVVDRGYSLMLYRFDRPKR